MQGKGCRRGREAEREGQTCRAYRKPVFLSWMQPMSRKLKVSSVTTCPLRTISWEKEHGGLLRTHGRAKAQPDGSDLGRTTEAGPGVHILKRRACICYVAGSEPALEHSCPTVACASLLPRPFFLAATIVSVQPLCKDHPAATFSCCTEGTGTAQS